MGYTAQVRFDSHVIDLLRVATDLVNLLTCEETGGRESNPPTGSYLRQVLSQTLIREDRAPTVTYEDAAILQRFALEARPVFEAVADEDFNEAAARVNELLRWTCPQPRLDLFDGAWHMHFHGPTDRLGEGWVAGCAAALTMAIGSADAGRLGVCEAPRCDRAYVDRSKNGTRRFCGVTCQNRVKNTNHRRADNPRPRQ